MVDTGERLGVFGGTFDPPHIGHFVAAMNAFHAVSLDRVLLVVSNIPWQKASSRLISPPDVRLEMVRAGIEGHPELEACDLEIQRGGESCTADTLAALAEQDPSRRLFLIVGADAASGLRTWRRWKDLSRLATLVVVNRGEPAGTSAGPPGDWPGPVVSVAIPRLDISSTDLRRRVAQGEPIDYLVPAGVASVVADRLLYR